MSLRPNERTEVRRNRYKVAVDADEGRRRREDNMVEIRKNRREESLQKKRREGLQAQQSFSSSVHASTVEKKVLWLYLLMPVNLCIQVMGGAVLSVDRHCISRVYSLIVLILYFNLRLFGLLFWLRSKDVWLGSVVSKWHKSGCTLSWWWVFFVFLCWWFLIDCCCIVGESSRDGCWGLVQWRQFAAGGDYAVPKAPFNWYLYVHF